MKYFKFINNNSGSNKKKSCLLYKFITLLIPKANPDFENKFDHVHIWYIEYDEGNNYTNREIGLDPSGAVIVKAPYKKNLGLWVDTNLTLDEYERWNIEDVPQNIFCDLWEKDIVHPQDFAP